jgi:hypothetical protein
MISYKYPFTFWELPAPLQDRLLWDFDLDRSYEESKEEFVHRIIQCDGCRPQEKTLIDLYFSHTPPDSLENMFKQALASLGYQMKTVRVLMVKLNGTDGRP